MHWFPISPMATRLDRKDSRRCSGCGRCFAPGRPRSRSSTPWRRPTRHRQIDSATRSRCAPTSSSTMAPKVLQANPRGYGTDVSLLKNAGSGPFRIADFQPGQFVEFTRFDGFFEEAYLDKLRIQNVADPSARFLALKGGQAHERDQDAPARE